MNLFIETSVTAWDFVQLWNFCPFTSYQVEVMSFQSSSKARVQKTKQKNNTKQQKYIHGTKRSDFYFVKILFNVIKSVKIDRN